MTTAPQGLAIVVDHHQIPVTASDGDMRQTGSVHGKEGANSLDRVGSGGLHRNERSNRY